VKPGQRMRFRAVDVTEAHRLRHAWQASLAAAAGGPVTAMPAA